MFAQAAAKSDPRDFSALLTDKVTNSFSSLLGFLAYFLVCLVCLSGTLLFYSNADRKKINREE